jgi:hypothetical protein
VIVTVCSCDSGSNHSKFCNGNVTVSPDLAFHTSILLASLYSPLNDSFMWIT